MSSMAMFTATEVCLLFFVCLDFFVVLINVLIALVLKQRKGHSKNKTKQGLRDVTCAINFCRAVGTRQRFFL